MKKKLQALRVLMVEMIILSQKVKALVLIIIQTVTQARPVGAGHHQVDRMVCKTI